MKNEPGPGPIRERRGWKIGISLVLGVVIGVAGLISAVPALEMLALVFGLGQIVWFVWLGIVMLRTSPTAEA